MEFLGFLGVRGYFYLKFLNLEFPKLEFPNLVIASEAKQSLRNSKFILRNSKFPTMSSPSLPCVILGLDPRISIWNSRILEFLNDINTKSP